MRKNKQGISLIVLIITIIVMIILSGIIILTIDNSGIISKASGAVSKHDEAQIKELAQVGYMEAKKSGRISKYDLREAIKEYLIANGITRDVLEQIDIIITSNGVNVRAKGRAYTEEELENAENVWAAGTEGTTNVIAEYDEITATLTIKPNGTDESVAMQDYRSNTLTVSSNAPWKGEVIETITIEEGVTYIGSCAFMGVTQTKTINLPSTLTEVGDYAFVGSSIETIEFPDSVTQIGKGALGNAKALKSVKLPATLEFIPEEMFLNDTSLEQLELPASIKTIKYRAFGNTGIKELDLPEGLTTIEKQAFIESPVSSLHIPSSVTTMGNNVFENGTKFTFGEDFDITLSTIHQSAFLNCTSFFNEYKTGSIINGTGYNYYDVEINGKTKRMTYSVNSSSDDGWSEWK